MSTRGVSCIKSLRMKMRHLAHPSWGFSRNAASALSWNLSRVSILEITELGARLIRSRLPCPKFTRILVWTRTPLTLLVMPWLCISTMIT